MPEGHTLHRLARVHHKNFRGQAVAVSSPQGRFATGAALVDGRTFVRAEAYGKHLFHVYGPDAVVHVHLGLYGRFEAHTGEVTPPRGAVRMRMVGQTAWTDLRGAITCEVITPDEVDAVVARLGPDPLRRDADPERAWARLSRSRVSIGALLMDQKVLAGVGNVYRAEVLFRHNIGPHRPGRDLDRAEFDALWLDLVELMKVGVSRGRIITLAPEHRRRGLRSLRVPAHRAGVPGVPDAGAHRGDGGPQPVLVPHLPAGLTLVPAAIAPTYRGWRRGPLVLRSVLRFAHGRHDHFQARRGRDASSRGAHPGRHTSVECSTGGSYRRGQRARTNVTQGRGGGTRCRPARSCRGRPGAA